MFAASYSKHDFHFDTMSIPSSLQHLAETKPDSEAFVFLLNGPGGDTREAITWKQLFKSSAAYAKSLMALGVQRGDIVAITVPNGSKCLYAMFGSIFAGAIPLGIINMFQDGEDVVALFKKLEKCSAYVIESGNTWNILKPLLTSYTKSGCVTSEILQSLKYLIFTSAPENDTEILTTEDFLDVPTEDQKLPDIDQDEIAVLFQTTGTTGSPKIVAQTHRSISWTAQSYSAACYEPGDRIYNDALFRWSGGWPFNVVTGETRVCISGHCHPTTLAVAGIKQERCTVFEAVPPYLQRLIDHEAGVGEDWPVRAVVTGGMPVSKKLASLLNPTCSSMINLYGASEALVITTKTVDLQNDNFEDFCCGFPVHGQEVKVVDEEGETVQVNTRGEIYVKGPGTFARYFNDPGQTKQAMTEDGWYKTGDIGYMTDDGDFFVHGRQSETIRCGSTTVDPSAMEAVIKSCRGIDDAVVVPIPDDTFYQLMCAFVIRESSSTITEDTVIEFLEDKYAFDVGGFTVKDGLRFVFFVESFPLSETGKVSRKLLTDQAVKTIQGK